MADAILRSHSDPSTAAELLRRAALAEPDSWWSLANDIYTSSWVPGREPSNRVQAFLANAATPREELSAALLAIADRNGRLEEEVSDRVSELSELIWAELELDGIDGPLADAVKLEREAEALQVAIDLVRGRVARKRGDA